MKKRVLVLAMIGTLGLSLFACGSNEATATKETTETTEAQVETASEDEEDTKSEAPSEDLEENTISFIKQAAEDCAPSIDFSDCATFTEMLNKGKVTAGMGYANEKVGETDCFFVTSGTYDNLDGNMAGIDATIFVYEDGAIKEIGKICSGGTAYPIAIQGDYIYTASNHWVCKYVIENNTLLLKEKASVIYDTEGNGTYFYESEENKETVMDTAEAEKLMTTLYEEMGNAQVIGFQPVTK